MHPQPFKTTPHSLELLAPAGKPDCFYAALDAGANAVYVGVDAFNARLRAPNFTLKTLSHLVPYAHAHKVKVYVTLNTLVRNIEIPDALNLVFALSQIGVDAIIAADIGLITLAQAAFPKLPIHASTQMSIHNSAGCEAIKRMGISRAVLARECTFEEIKAIRHATNLELEIFVHGAICYSYSGACLASSSFGGQSGNRGRCTQVCRRQFTQNGVTGNFFSPYDLSLLQEVPALVALGIASLKIEGRMKSPHYVHTVVKAYRGVLDNPSRIQEYEEMLKNDLARNKTTLFFKDPHQTGIINSQTGSGTGINLGTISACVGTTISVSTSQALCVGDTIRIHPATGFEGESYRIHAIAARDNVLDITLDKQGACACGDRVYLTAFKKEYTPPRPKTASFPARYQTIFNIASRIIAAHSPQQQPNRGTDKVWIKVDSPDWLPIIADKADSVIISFDKIQTLKFFDNTDLLLKFGKKLIVSLPQFIPQGLLASWRGVIDTGKRKGISRWMAPNIGTRALFGPADTVYADWSIPCMNRPAQYGVLKTGASLFTYSLEDDFVNIRGASNSQGLVYLYGTIPLFISRIHPGAQFNETITDAHKNTLRVVERDGLFYTLQQSPLCLLQKRDKLSELGLKTFILDLSFLKASQQTLSSILVHYKEKTKIPQTTMVNFKLGLA